MSAPAPACSRSPPASGTPGQAGRLHAAGGDRLIGTLKAGPLGGVKVGAHGPRFGFEASLVYGTRKIEVQNDRGVPFPNHGENIVNVSADALVYLSKGKARPYASVGMGGAFFSVDLDNIRDQENYARPTLGVGLGAKFEFGSSSDPDAVQLEIQAKNQRVIAKGPINAFDLRTVTIAVIYTRYKGQPPVPTP